MREELKTDGPRKFGSDGYRGHGESLNGMRMKTHGEFQKIRNEMFAGDG